LTERFSVNSEDKVAYETELKKLIKEIRRHNDNIGIYILHYLIIIKKLMKKGTLKKEIEIKKK